ncbi:MAG: 30S ribosomal protein S9 [candidate division Zixibacteria bacterium RBG_16_48_11]|nr:MAG: 30S ribosomal protein S9 [candidate division Zixibacteria bacterium RBG_16_48_11]
MENQVPSYIDATGRRKEATATVRLLPGQGKLVVNGKEANRYLQRKDLLLDLRKPLVVTETEGKYDVIARARGGGISGQTGAIQLGIARALARLNENFKSLLRQHGLLTRDSRVVERKKYGRPKARKRFQYSKR